MVRARTDQDDRKFLSVEYRIFVGGCVFPESQLYPSYTPLLSLGTILTKCVCLNSKPP